MSRFLAFVLIMVTHSAALAVGYGLGAADRSPPPAQAVAGPNNAEPGPGRRGPTATIGGLVAQLEAQLRECQQNLQRVAGRAAEPR